MPGKNLPWHPAAEAILASWRVD